jgi:hypothetical protein
MLRRNGELCEHSVPRFKGRLTTSELEAYETVWPLVQERMEAFIVPPAAGETDRSIPLSDLVAQIRGLLGERFPTKERSLNAVARALAARTMQAVLPSHEPAAEGVQVNTGVPGEKPSV